MGDTDPQIAAGKVLWHFTMSLDGFVAGPNHEMDWMTGVSFRPGLVDEYVRTTGAVLGGRNGWDHYPDASSVYGGAWGGPIFVLTHHPEDATPADGVTFLNCGPAEAVRIGLEAAGGKNLEVLSPTIGRQRAHSVYLPAARAACHSARPSSPEPARLGTVSLAVSSRGTRDADRIGIAILRGRAVSIAVWRLLTSSDTATCTIVARLLI
jgi:hypothetical protein